MDPKIPRIIALPSSSSSSSPPEPSVLAPCSTSIQYPAANRIVRLSGQASSPPPLSTSEASPIPSARHASSPPSSAFVSASASPFLSPPNSTPAVVLSPPPELEHGDDDENGSNKDGSCKKNSCELLYDRSRDAVLLTSSSVEASAAEFEPLPCCQPPVNYVSSAGSSTPAPHPSSISLLVSSPHSSTRPRSCDVYIGCHGHSSSISRFFKWLRAELELQGIACFSADRARFRDALSHDIAHRIIKSCAFGVVIITKKTFQNLYSVEELRTFMQRKNLVPLFFELAPADCLARDIVERRGEIWEKDGGELWRVYDGDEREWIDTLDGLSRIEEWKLEAYNGNWRNCILKAVSLLGTRLGRRSVVERERVRKERVDYEEFPFPRNPAFVGREGEIRELETILFSQHEEQYAEKDAEIEKLRAYSGCFVRSVDWVPSRRTDQFQKEGYVARRRSDADRWHRCMDDGVSEGVAARRSDADRWRDIASQSASSNVHRRQDAWDTASADIEFSRSRAPHRLRDTNRGKRRFHRAVTHRRAQGFREFSSVELDPLAREGGRACIVGLSGIGKTEMVLEYAYRFSQRYRMVLWVGGETRYLRQNYLNLSLFLGLDVGTESQIGPEHGRMRSFEEQEMEAFQRVKRELQRDVPYLLVIDNLESERDWWDGRDISELLPRAGGATHVIVTTRLSNVMNFDYLELSYLSGIEALSLMRGRREFTSEELDVLKEIEAKLGRLTLGLGIVGTLLSEFPMMPLDLLEKMEKMSAREWTWGVRDDVTLKNNPYLLKLLGVCFSFVDRMDGTVDLARSMAWVGGWFAPSPIPLSLLALAASKYSETTKSLKLLRTIPSVLLCCFVSSQSKKLEFEAGAVLVKIGIARNCSRQGWISFHEIIQLYTRKRGGVEAAKAMVKGIKKRGAISPHLDHFWAACFLVLGFVNDPVVVELKVVELLTFIRRGALQLAVWSFMSFSRCYAALELLRLCSNALEDVEKSFVSQLPDWRERFLCWRNNSQQVDEYVWHDVTLLKALLLETRAKLMLKGGQFDAGEEVCRTCISIRTVMLGENHPDTLSAQETLAKLVRGRSNRWA